MSLKNKKGTRDKQHVLHLGPEFFRYDTTHTEDRFSIIRGEERVVTRCPVFAGTFVGFLSGDCFVDPSSALRYDRKLVVSNATKGGSYTMFWNIGNNVPFVANNVPKFNRIRHTAPPNVRIALASFNGYLALPAMFTTCHLDTNRELVRPDDTTFLANYDVIDAIPFLQSVPASLPIAFIGSELMPSYGRSRCIVGDAGEKGLGLFATDVVPKNVCLGMYPGYVFQKRDDSVFCPFAFGIGEFELDAGTVSDLTTADPVFQSWSAVQYINEPTHKDEHVNTIFITRLNYIIPDFHIVCVYTTAEVPNGSQYFVDYGEDYPRSYKTHLHP